MTSLAREHRSVRAFARAVIGSKADALIGAATLIGVVGSLWAFGPDLLTALAGLSHRGTVPALAGYVVYSSAVLALLGGAWLAVSGLPLRSLGVFAWARIVREAAADLLPFSQVGAIVIGFRIVLARGVEASTVYASFIADLATELGSQLLFASCGIGLLWFGMPSAADHGAVDTALVLGGGSLAILAAAVASATWTLPLAHRLVEVAMPRVATTIASSRARLIEIYRDRPRVALAFVLNLVGWFASAVGVWLVLRWVGVEVLIGRVVALESLICVLRSVAFAIPAGIGVQEAGYGVLGPLLGLPVEAALSIALLKRLRDVAVALPVLVIWQASRIGSRSVTGPERHR